MLGKLVRHVKRNWGVYSWMLGIVSFALLAIGSFVVLNERRETEGLLWLLISLILLIALPIGLMFIPRAFVRFFQWLSILHLHNWARKLGSHDYQKRNDALKALMKMGKKAVPIFASILSTTPAKLDLVDWNGHVARRLAARGLGILRAKEGFDALVGVLNDSDEILRKEAIWALRRIGDQRAIPVLILLLSEPLLTCEFVRNALRELGAGEVMDAWYQVLKHRDRIALAKLKTYREQIVEALFRGLERNVFSEQVALNAIWALSEIGTVEIIPRLRSLALQHPNDEVCKACFQAIDRLALISRLPRPATSPTLDTSTLPCPATFSEIDASNLPAIPLEEFEGRASSKPETPTPNA